MKVLAMQISNANPGIKVVAIYSDGTEGTHYFPFASKRTSKRDLKEWCEQALGMRNN